MIKFFFAVRSDSVIRVNDDAAYAGPHLLVLASGLSTMAGPGVPASVAVEKLRPLDADGDPSEIDHALSDGVEQVGKALRSLMDAEPLLHGMGASLTAVLRRGCDIAISQVGDSRAYVMREGELLQLTREHTVARLLFDEGVINHAELESDLRASWLTRVIDGSRDVQADLAVRRAEPGDRYMLCSRSLWSSVSFEAIAHVLSRKSAPQEAVDVLVRAARRQDSLNTVTCVIADVISESSTSLPEPVTAGAALTEVARPGTSS